MADIRFSKSRAEMRAGSSPAIATKFLKKQLTSEDSVVRWKSSKWWFFKNFKKCHRDEIGRHKGLNVVMTMRVHTWEIVYENGVNSADG